MQKLQGFKFVVQPKHILVTVCRVEIPYYPVTWNKTGSVKTKLLIRANVVAYCAEATKLYSVTVMSSEGYYMVLCPSSTSPSNDATLPPATFPSEWDRPLKVDHTSPRYTR